VSRRAAAAAGNPLEPRRDARVAARARDDADPVPLPGRAAAQPVPDRAHLRRRQAEAVAERVQAAVRRDEAVRVRGRRVGSAPERKAGPPGLRDPDPEEEQVDADRRRPADERQRRDPPHDPAEEGLAAARLVAEAAALQLAAPGALTPVPGTRRVPGT